MFERKFRGPNGVEILRVSPVTLKVELIGPHGRIAKYVGVRELREKYGIELDSDYHFRYLDQAVREIEYRIASLEERLRGLLDWLHTRVR